MNDEKRAHIVRLLLFHTSEKIQPGDQERILGLIAAEAGCTKEEVWAVYSELLEQMLTGG